MFARNFINFWAVIPFTKRSNRLPGYDENALKESNDEMTTLLKTRRPLSHVERQVSRAPIYPKVFGFLIIATIWVSVAMANLEGNSRNFLSFAPRKEKMIQIPDLGALPIIAPEICQFGITFASLAALVTVYCFHSCIRQKFSVPEHQSKSTIVIISGACGAGAMFSLVLFAFLPNMGPLRLLPTLSVHENIFMLSFFLLALFHACTTLKFVLDVRNSQVLPEMTSRWLKIKVALIIILLLVSIAFLSLVVILSQNEETIARLMSKSELVTLKIVYRALSYALLHLHIFYLMTFVYDLEYVTVNLHFHPDITYFDGSNLLDDDDPDL